MASHLARRGAIWWARLAVPERLREAVGRREFTQSCRTPDLPLAKLVAAALLVEWRTALMRLESVSMNSNALKLLAPSLTVGTTVSILEAEALGVDRANLLRVAASGHLKLHCRMAGVEGYVVNASVLDIDPLTGGRDIPSSRLMPASAIQAVKSGVYAVVDSANIANAILAHDLLAIDLLAFEMSSTADDWFVPNATLTVDVKLLEISTKGLQVVREFLVKRVPVDELGRLVGHVHPQTVVSSVNGGAKASILFSQAVKTYCSDPSGLPADLQSKIEQGQREKGMLYFAEFMGDLPLSNITPDMLREYRDGPLRSFPGKANHIPKMHRRSTMKATIEALEAAGVEWPLMSLDMQRERMTNLRRLFDWLYKKEWITANPAASLQGETGLTKAELKNVNRKKMKGSGSGDDEEGRQPFTQGELRQIFGQPHYTTGDGCHISKGNQTWYPFEYWLPLLGAYAGCRIGEACQLHLDDVREVSGVWVIDINQATDDKSLKTDATSARRVPIHPKLIELGLLDYCDRLRTSSFRRVFPELTYSTSDARYAKEPIRKMSAMLAGLGMARDGEKVFHCFRHNANNALMRVPMTQLTYADENLRKFIRHKIMGHAVGDDVNVMHYTATTLAEMQELMAGLFYDLPQIEKFNVEMGVQAVRAALLKKQGDRRGREDMGPSNSTIYGV